MCLTLMEKTGLKKNKNGISNPEIKMAYDTWLEHKNLNRHLPLSSKLDVSSSKVRI